MRHLYLQIYLAFLAIGAAAVVTVLVFARLHFSPRDLPAAAQWRGAAALFAERLPPDAPPERNRAALRALGQRLQLDLVLWDMSGSAITTPGLERPPPAPPTATDMAWNGSTLVLTVPDGRRLGIVMPERMFAPFSHFVTVLGVLAAAIAVFCYPLARRITRRLEQLQRGVEGLGAGDLRTRVAVSGRDEIADLARRFNTTADRVEALVDGQRRMLASASHELRSPLARVRMALELVADESPERRDLVLGATRDIEELDVLVGDLLLASRLEARPPAQEPVDLAALATEEAARAGATIRAGGPARVQGDAAALRRMLRNLLENAARHGKPPIEVRITAEPARWRVDVEDAGPGVPASERERIFEAFYRPAGHREADGGVGLGLALVRQIAERHGGSARCEAREPAGSRFTVVLPRGP